MATGRPTKKTPELIEKILDLIETTDKGMHAICEESGITYKAFKEWLREDEGLSANYARAKNEQAHVLFDKMREVAYRRDEDHTPFTGINVIQRDKLIVDTLKFQVSKLLPKVYSDKIDVTSNGETIASPTINVMPKNDGPGN